MIFENNDLMELYTYISYIHIIHTNHTYISYIHTYICIHITYIGDHPSIQPIITHTHTHMYVWFDGVTYIHTYIHTWLTIHPSNTSSMRHKHTPSHPIPFFFLFISHITCLVYSRPCILSITYIHLHTVITCVVLGCLETGSPFILLHAPVLLAYWISYRSRRLRPSMRHSWPVSLPTHLLELGSGHSRDKNCIALNNGLR